MFDKLILLLQQKESVDSLVCPSVYSFTSERHAHKSSPHHITCPVQRTMIRCESDLPPFLVTGGRFLDPDCEPTPRERLARFGRGGGGINSASVSTRDTERLGEDVFIRCALERLGNAGGWSSSSGLRSVSISDPSSSSAPAPVEGGNTWTVMPDEFDVFVSGTVAAGVPVDSQYLSSEVII